MIYTLDNILKHSEKFSIIKKSLVRGNNKRPNYVLLEDLTFKLSNNDLINIPKGFIWDLSSVPRPIWWLLSPDGDFDVAYLIHDYLWLNKDTLPYNQKFTDVEMLKWADVVNGDKITKLIDNRLRYVGVRMFGWLVWNDYVSIK